jgi:histidyl-tRNA synthetase
MIRALKGMKDIFYPQNEKFIRFLDIASNIAKRYGFEYIETPILEESSLYLRSVGDSSDIVGKEMYRFVDKGGNDVSLRPEGTAGVVRAFIEAKKDRVQGVHRYYYHGPMFRYERPQKGRFREFHQFGCESFGSSSPKEDTNIILLTKDILDSLNIEYKLKLNSLGCRECITPYRETLLESLKKIEGLCEDCRRREETNPIRVFDCKNKNCKELLRDAPRITEHLCDECESDFETLRDLLKVAGVEYEIDRDLVRGLDYYTKSAFEFVSLGLGAQNAVAGGGRYDKLVESLGGRATPAIGFAIGVERVLDLFDMPQIKREGYYFGALVEEAREVVFKEAIKKREIDRVIESFDIKSLKAHLKAADKANARYCAIIGEDELKEGKIWIKDLKEKNEFYESIG